MLVGPAIDTGTAQVGGRSAGFGSFDAGQYETAPFMVAEMGPSKPVALACAEPMKPT